jgi:hypothetical protein
MEIARLQHAPARRSLPRRPLKNADGGLFIGCVTAPVGFPANVAWSVFGHSTKAVATDSSSLRGGKLLIVDWLARAIWTDMALDAEFSGGSTLQWIVKVAIGMTDVPGPSIPSSVYRLELRLIFDGWR